MPSTTSNSVSIPFDSSMVIRRHCRLFSIASAMYFPNLFTTRRHSTNLCMASFESTMEEMLCSSSTATLVAISIPRRIPNGFAPAVTVFSPSRTIACVNNVAVVVPSPAMSFVFEATSETSFAPYFRNDHLVRFLLQSLRHHL